MRADGNLGRITVEQPLQGRQRSANSGVIRDLAVLERDVEIGSDEHPLVADGGRLDRAGVPHASSFETRSTSRQLYPHSLSYQPKTFAVLPCAIVSSLSKMHENGEWTMSLETSGSVE